jgi:hypothetical protein
MLGRDARQCRERWTNYLAPDVSMEPWTTEEDTKLRELVDEYGFLWSWLSHFFPGRKDIALKKHYNRLKRRASKSDRTTNEPLDPNNTIFDPLDVSSSTDSDILYPDFMESDFMESDFMESDFMESDGSF